MTDTETVTASPAAPVAVKAAIKKKPTAAAKAKKVPATHPTTAVMVTAAIKELKEKKGSSLPAIKKYLAANYKVDSAKLAPFIRKFLKAAVAKGVLVQVNGTGAVGHFKLAAEAKKPAAKKAVAAKKKPVAKKSSAGSPKKRKLPAKKPKTAEPAAKKAKKVAAPKAAKAVKPTKSPAKAKKAAPATKTKPPKVVKKTTTTVKKIVPKKK